MERRRSSYSGVERQHASLLEVLEQEKLQSDSDAENKRNVTITVSEYKDEKNSLTEDEDENDDNIVPDGGWGWMVCFGSFAVNFILDGTLFSFGVLMLALLSDLAEDTSTTSWIGSTQMGIHMTMGPVISVLLQHYSIRQVTITGTMITSAGFVASVFAPNVYVLIFTYGFIGGVGIGMVFLPAIIVVGLYFNKKRAIATGIASSGSGCGTFAFAYIADVLLENFNWRGTILILAGLVLHCVVCGLLFRPLVSRQPANKKMKSNSTIPSHVNGVDAKDASEIKNLLKAGDGALKCNLDSHLKQDLGNSRTVTDDSGVGDIEEQALPNGNTPHDCTCKTNLDSLENRGNHCDNHIHNEDMINRLENEKMPLVVVTGSLTPEDVCLKSEVGSDCIHSPVVRDVLVGSDIITQKYTDQSVSHVSLPAYSDDTSKLQHGVDGLQQPESHFIQTKLANTLMVLSDPKNGDRSVQTNGTTKHKHLLSSPFSFLKDGFHRIGHITDDRPYTSVDHLHNIGRRSDSANHQHGMSPRMMRSEYKLNDFKANQVRSSYGLKSYCDHHSGQKEYHNQISKGLLRPILRKDIYYSGSVNHLPVYQQFGSLTTFVAAMTRASSSENSDVIKAKQGGCHQSRCCRLFNKLFPMSLLTNRLFVLLLITFTMWTAQSVSLTYLPDLAVSIGINRSDAAFLISIVGIANVLGRLLAGLITDCLHVPSIWLYFIALSVAAVVNIVIPYCQEYVLLQVCSAVFGLCMAVAVSMRTIVLAEQLGIEVLTESFGVVALFQGIAFTINPPIAGKLIDDSHSFKPPFTMAAVMYVISALSTLGVAILSRSRSGRMRNHRETINIGIDEEDIGNGVILTEEGDTETKMEKYV